MRQQLAVGIFLLCFFQLQRWAQQMVGSLKVRVGERRVEIKQALNGEAGAGWLQLLQGGGSFTLWLQHVPDSWKDELEETELMRP